MNDFALLISHHLGEVFQSDRRSGEYKVACPYCGTKSLWLNVVHGVFHCFGCQAGGSLSQLSPGLMTQIGSYVPKSRVKEPPKNVHKVVEEVLPKNYRQIARRGEFVEGWDYLMNRGVRPGSVEWGNYDGMSVCFPFRENRKVVYWQARRISPLVKRKTVNPTGINKSNYLYNIDLQDYGRPVLVVEGVFDALRSGGVATSGKTMSETQARKLLSLRPPCVFVCYDGDAYDQSRSVSCFLRSLSVYTTAVPVHIPEDKDPGDLGAEVFDYVAEAIEDQRLLLRAGLLSVSEIEKWLQVRRQAVERVLLP